MLNSRFISAGFLALLLLIAGACTKKGAESAPGVNGEGFAGGGRLDDARARLVKTYARWATAGETPRTFARDWGKTCRAKRTDGLCDRLKAFSEDTAKIAVARDFVETNRAQIAALLAGTRILAKPASDMNVRDPNGTLRPVDGLVPTTADEIWVSQTFITASSDDEIAALLQHEFLHLIKPGGTGARLGDYDNVTGYGQVLGFFNAIGAATATDPFETTNDVRDAILTDHPRAYYPFEDDEGSSLVWDWSGHANHGVVEGTVAFGEKGVAIDSGTALKLSSGGTVPGSIRLPAGTLDPSSTTRAVVEMFVFWKRTTEFQLLFGFDSYHLYFKADDFGFNSKCQDVRGIENTSLQNKWVHLVGKFVAGDSTVNELYVNGAPMTLAERWPGRCPANEVLTAAARLSGRNSDDQFRMDATVDELALYDHDLTAARIAAHYEASKFRRTGGSKTVQLFDDQAQSSVASVAIPTGCANPELLAFARDFEIACSTGTAAGACVGAPSQTTTRMRSKIENVTATGFEMRVSTDYPPWTGSAIGIPLSIDYQIICR